jgi:1,4-dihydroxy-2-naphthoate octaprenyltransferase
MFSHIPSELRRNRADAPPAQRSRGRAIRTDFIRMIAQMGRLQAIPALLTPVIWGAATARWQIETVSIWRALALLFSFGALALAYNFLGAYVDYMRHIRLDGQSHAPAAGQESPRPARALLFDGFDWMRQGLLRAETFLSFGLMAGTIYVLAAIWLGFFVGWPFWFFAMISGLMCSVSLWPVVRYSRRFWWVGDLAYWLGMGVIPLLGTYFVLTGVISRLVLWIAFAPATFAWLASLSYCFYSWHRDWRLRRRTLVVVFGPERALDIAAIFSVAGFISLILLMATGAVPVWTILVLGAFPLFLRAFARARVWPFSRQAGIATVEYAINAVILAGLLWLAPLWLT